MMANRFLMLAVLLAAVPGAAQETVDRATAGKQGQPSALGIRQQRVNRMMQSLERLFLTMAQTLEETEPERAKRLVKAFQQSKELLIEQRMQEIVRLLNLANLNNAGEEQEKLLSDLRKLVATLLDDEIDPEEILDEMDRLKRWREMIQELVKEEQQQKRESDKVANKDETLADLDRQIKAVERLIRREKQLMDKTSKADAQDSQGLGGLAEEQQGIQKATEELAQEIAGGQTGENQGRGVSGSQNAPKEGTPAGSSSSSQGTPSASSKNGQQPASSSSEPSEQPLRKAAEHEQLAQEKLKKQEPNRAQVDEQNAVDELKKALDELKRERERLEKLSKLSKQDFDQMANKQDQTAGKTDQLKQEMAKASQPDGSQPGAAQPGGAQPGDGNPGEQQPGQQAVANAGQSMQKASGQLKNQQAGNAAQDQKEAVDELNKALDEIQDRIAELQEELDDEKLVRLEDIFLQMLERQQQASAGTIALDKTKTESEGKLRRADRLALKKVAQEERELALMAQQALDLLTEDGTSIVFPTVVEDLRDRLNTVGKLLDQQRTDDYTRAMQQEVETTLEELIEALQKAKQASEGQAAPPGEPGGAPPLLPNTAELKLLRALQLRVNRRTKAFHKARPQRELDGVLRGEITKISTLQFEIANMVKEILDRK